MSWLEPIKSKFKSSTSPVLPKMPGQEHSFEWQGHNIVYSHLGEGLPTLVLHGINASAWRFEMRRNLEPLAQNGYEVFAPDMPGFGKSTRLPQSYTSAQYISFIKDFALFIKERTGQPVIVVATSLIAAHVIGAVAQSPQLFEALLLICPTGLQHLEKEATPSQVNLFKRLSGRAGYILFWLLTSRLSSRIFLARDGYYDKNYITKDVIEGYHRAARYPNAQYAPFSFITFQLNYNVRQDWPQLTQPTAIIWGDKSTVLPPSDMDEFLRLRPTTEHYIITNARLGLNDERADEFNALALRVLKQWQLAAATNVNEATNVS